MTRTLFAICQISQELFFWGDLELLCFIFIKKIDRFKSPFPKITSLSGLTLNTIDLHCYYKYRKWFLWVMPQIKAVVIHRNEWSLTWYFWWEIYTSIPNLNPLTEFGTSRKSTQVKVSSHETSLIWSGTPFHLPQEQSKMQNTMSYTFSSEKESQWKLRQQKD